MRFRFYILLVIFSLSFASCKETDPKKTEYKILSEFLEFSESSYVDRGHIEALIYDIQSPTDTMGRAFRISKKLFLTNHHVIVKVLSGKYAQLVKQENRGFLRNQEGEFDIIHYDKTRDIALLRLKDETPDQADLKKSNQRDQKEKDKINKLKEKEESLSNDEAYFRLYPKILRLKDKVSEFIRFNGDDIKHKGYHLTFGGIDLYNKKNYIDYVGEFILPPNSALYEKKGYVLEYRKKIIQELTKKLPSKPKFEIITSIPVYQGESGSPVFYEKEKNKFYLAGITTKTLSLKEMISTPNHPEGILAHERTVSFIVHRQAIFDFVQSYLKKLKNEIESQKLKDLKKNT